MRGVKHGFCLACGSSFAMSCAMIVKLEDRAPGAQKLLLAVEMIIAERGIEGASIRQILRVAKQGNNSAIYHHFGSKRLLIRAIYDIRQTEVDDCRALRMQRLPHFPDDVRGLMELFLLPVLDAFQGRQRWIYSQFILHLILNDPFDEAFDRAHEGPAIRLVHEALRARCSDLSDQVFTMRLSVAVTNFLMGVSYGDRVASLTGEHYPRSDQYLGDLITAGCTLLTQPSFPVGAETAV